MCAPSKNCSYTAFAFFVQLCAAHLFVVLSETRTTPSRILRTELPFPNTHIHFFTHDSHYTGGVSISVAKDFIAGCSRWGICSLFDGRVLYFGSDSVKGSLDRFGTYFHSADSDLDLRVSCLRIIRKYIRPLAHTLIGGDFNFVVNPMDRINKKGEMVPFVCSGDVRFWNANFDCLTEVDQPLYNCYHSFGAVAALAGR